jgi:high-affinity iron transporter
MNDKPATRHGRLTFRILLLLAALIVAGVLVWQGITSGGNPDPTAPNTSPTAALLNIAVLVFREGLECILVLSAITASMTGNKQAHRRPVMAGAGIGFIATIITWFIAVGIVSNLTGSVSALNLQAATGLLAVVVLLVIMNWFFHKIYWGGWMTMHHRRKRNLLESADGPETSKASLLWGLGLLGFTSLYREGFEVVLFLQSYYLRLGGVAVLLGALLGLFFTGLVALLTFVAHRKLPYRKMLVFTGILLGVVLLVMVGEQAQEMQLAHWISTTPVAWLENVIPPWMGLWFSIFPTVETLAAQALAAGIVIGSYFLARGKTSPPCQDETEVILGHAADCPLAGTPVDQNKSTPCPRCGVKPVKKP